MQMFLNVVLLVVASLSINGNLFAAEELKFIRWTQFADSSAEFTELLNGLNIEANTTLLPADFVKSEARDLAYTSYERYDQIRDSVRVKSASVRIWRNLVSKSLLQVEANLSTSESQAETESLAFPVSIYDQEQKAAFQAAAIAKVGQSKDARVRDISSEFLWDGGLAIVQVEVKARRGVHTYVFDARTRKLLSSNYRSYPHADLGEDASEFSIPARVFPVYEEYKKEILPRKFVRLKYLKKSFQKPDFDPYTALRDRRYLYSKYDSVQGSTADGQANGFWNFSWVRQLLSAAQAEIPFRPNTFDKGPVYLHGRYATISLHPEVYTKFPGIGFGKQFSNTAAFSWKEDPETGFEMVPGAALLGRSLDSRFSALQRSAVRHPNHDPITYINNGFDEVQVYYAINELFDTLRPLGMIDPDLGERPFHAVLFDPDVESQDNAYYTDDTINFSTYSKEALNYARDNTTIWHELGHGVMDRLMGERLELADTGGLSEGMADFVAELVIQGSYGAKAFPGAEDQRIRNDIGFFLTNEVHDDGEAYGGVMKSMLDLAIKKYGHRQGLAKITDLVLEAMRFSRDHPALTAEDWFDRMYFADTAGRATLRESGELSSVITEALNSRNFAMEEDRAVFSLKHEGNEVVAGEAGSRDNEISLELKADESVTKTVTVNINDGKNFSFKYPVAVKVFYNSGPLQGAIDWQNEDSEPSLFEISRDGESIDIPLTVKGTCDAINRSDGSCSDFAYVQIWNKDGQRPIAKKRFYLRINTQL